MNIVTVHFTMLFWENARIMVLDLRGVVFKIAISYKTKVVEIQQ